MSFYLLDNAARGRGLPLAVLAIITALVAGCAPPRSQDVEPPAPRSREAWTAILTDVRAFEHAIGFTATNNFREFDAGQETFPFCGYVSRLYLPYSYEDPAIHWLDVATKEECHTHAGDADVAFGETEAVGERATPVTSSMLAAPLGRLVYLVIHEDCHDQFALPLGIEEPLCNVIAYHGVTAFAERRFDTRSPERAALQTFARESIAHARLSVSFYEQLAALYGRGGKIPEADLLREREQIFRRAERTLDWHAGTMNNVWLANTMTYSRHYEPLERVHEKLGGDLARTVAFFRTVDARKPTRAEVMRRHGLKTDEDLAFVRAYEAAVLETIERELAAASPRT